MNDRKNPHPKGGLTSLKARLETYSPKWVETILVRVFQTALQTQAQGGAKHGSSLCCVELRGDSLGIAVLARSPLYQKPSVWDLSCTPRRMPIATTAWRWGLTKSCWTRWNPVSFLDASPRTCPFLEEWRSYHCNPAVPWSMSMEILSWEPSVAPVLWCFSLHGTVALASFRLPCPCW